MTTPRLTAAVPVLPVRDVRHAADFYVAQLGFTLAYADGGYAVLVRNGVEVHLWAATDDAWQQPGRKNPVVSGAESFLAGTGSCRIRVDGIELLHEACRAAGIVHPNGRLANKPYGLTEFAVLDGDGNLLTFFAPIAA